MSRAARWLRQAWAWYTRPCRRCGDPEGLFHFCLFAGPDVRGAPPDTGYARRLRDRRPGQESRRRGDAAASGDQGASGSDWCPYC